MIYYIVLCLTFSHITEPLTRLNLMLELLSVNCFFIYWTSHKRLHACFRTLLNSSNDIGQLPFISESSCSIYVCYKSAIHVQYICVAISNTSIHYSSYISYMSFFKVALAIVITQRNCLALGNQISYTFFHSHNLFAESHAYNCLLKNELLGTEIDDLKVLYLHTLLDIYIYVS